MDEGGPPSVGKLLIGLAIYLVLAVPMFAYLWATLNELLTGYIDPRRVAVAVAVLIPFVIVLGLLVRSIKRWEEQREEAAPPRRTDRR